MQNSMVIRVVILLLLMPTLSHGMTVAEPNSSATSVVHQLQQQRMAGKVQAAEAAFALAKHFAAEGAWHEADRLMGEALALQPTNLDYLQFAVQSAFDQGRFQLAQQRLEQAMHHPVIEQQPPLWLHLNDNLAVIHLAKKEPRRAAAVLESSLQRRSQLLEPGDSSIAGNLYQLASVQISLKGFAMAEQQLKLALQIMQGQEQREPVLVAKILHNLGELYRQTGEHTAAKAILGKSLEFWEKSQDQSGGMQLTEKILRSLTTV
jgi:tetratricopeptide (TPR) repeat protein